MNNFFSRIKQIKKDERGNILFMSILVLTSVLMASLTIANLTLSGIILSGTQVRSIKAYYAADAGIEESLYWVRSSSTATSTLDGDIFDVATSTLNNESTYSVDFTTWSGGNIIGSSTRDGGYVRNLKSEGEFGNLRRTVEAQFGFIPWFEIETPCSTNSLDKCDTEFKCENIGFAYWYSTTCNAVPPGISSGETNQIDCSTAGGYWHEPTTTCYDIADPDQGQGDYEPGVCSPDEGLQYCVNESSCQAQSAYWYFNRCNELACECDNEQDCIDVGGVWYSETCNLYCDSTSRSLCRDQSECQNYGEGVWCVNQCLSGWGVCNDETACNDAGWYWFANNTCNEHCDLTNQSLCRTELECEAPDYGQGYWFSDTCNATPE